MTENFVGRHMLIDVISKSNKINNQEAVYDYLIEQTNLLGMTIVHPPMVFKFPYTSGMTQRLKKKVNDLGGKILDEVLEKDLLEGGVSGTVIWLESHSCFHSWINSNYFSLDVYSCQNFNSQEVLDLVINTFNPSKIKGLDVLRFTDRVPESQVIDINLSEKDIVNLKLSRNPSKYAA